MINDSEDFLSGHFGLAKIRSERLRLSTSLSSKHDAENCHENSVGFSQGDVAVCQELCRGIIKYSEDSHLDELCEAKHYSDDVTFLN